MNTPGFSQQVTFLTVSDLEASSKFYGETLGLRLARDQGSCRIYHLCDGSYVGICTGKPPQWPKGLTFTMVSDDVDEWYKHLTNLGVKIRNPPRLNDRYQIYHFYLNDPDGYTLEIQRFTDPLE